MQSQPKRQDELSPRSNVRARPRALAPSSGVMATGISPAIMLQREILPRINAERAIDRRWRPGQTLLFSGLAATALWAGIGLVVSHIF